MKAIEWGREGEKGRGGERERHTEFEVDRFERQHKGRELEGLGGYGL